MLLVNYIQELLQHKRCIARICIPCTACMENKMVLILHFHLNGRIGVRFRRYPGDSSVKTLLNNFKVMRYEDFINVC